MDEIWRYIRLVALFIFSVICLYFKFISHLCVYFLKRCFEFEFTTLLIVCYYLILYFYQPSNLIVISFLFFLFLSFPYFLFSLFSFTFCTLPSFMASKKQFAPLYTFYFLNVLYIYYLSFHSSSFLYFLFLFSFLLLISSRFLNVVSV